MESGYPSKLIVEPTTYCNFTCSMCVKQSEGCTIKEGEADKHLARALQPFYEHAESVVFTGIGEPLLHPELESYIFDAKERMPTGGLAGFQSNGHLLTKDRAMSLVQSGVDRVCLSIDSVEESRFSLIRNGGKLQEIEMAVESMTLAKKITGARTCETGLEFVLMKKNIGELPGVVSWAGERGIDFILVSHLSPYSKQFESEIAFCGNMDRSEMFFQEHRRRALKQGLDINRYQEILWKYIKSDHELAILRYVKEMKQEADSKDIFLNMKKLFEEDRSRENLLVSVFQEAMEVAENHGIQLSLPSIRPKHNRSCSFIEDHCMFITWDGKISPCYLLWHQYHLMRDGFVKHVTPQYFGNILDPESGNSWLSPSYQAFREKVSLYDYPYCVNCSIAPCSYMLDEPFQTDCYSIDIPCGDCGWNMGLYNCLN